MSNFGVFVEQVVLVNRAPVSIDVTFDGASKTLVPGENLVPAVVVPYAKNQNPIMGSQDPYNPQIEGCRYLVGVKGKDDCTPLTKAEWEDHCQRPCREDEQRWFEDKYGTDSKAKLVTRGKGRKSMASSRSEANAAVSGLSNFSSRA